MDKFKIKILPNKKVILSICSNILSMGIIIGIMMFIYSCDDNIFIGGYNKDMEEIQIEDDLFKKYSTKRDTVKNK